MSMRTRREQVQAYRFLTRRIVSGLLAGEPETNELPMRRFAYAVFGGLLVAVLVLAGGTVWGLLRPGGRKPVENAIIVERETGAKYLYLSGRLHPVLNWTSARLILAQSKPVVKTMAQASLRDVPRGRPVGIPDAPDALPARAALLGLPWTACTAPRAPGSVAYATHLVVGRPVPGGAALGAGDGLLVSVGEPAQRYLLWRDRRLRVRDNATVAALGWAAVRPAPVGEAFLAALTPGPDLAPLAVPDAGAPAGRALGGAPATVGQLFRAAGQHYILLRAGLAPVGQVTARLAGRPPTEISAAEVGSALVNTAVEPPGLPSDIPSVRGADAAAMTCAGFRAGSTELVLEAHQQVAADLAATVESAGSGGGTGADGAPVADRVLLAGGHGALVTALPPPGVTATGIVFLLTDQGLKYPLPRAGTDKVQASLGYERVRPVAVPAALLALVPTAAALDPAVASRFAPPPAVRPSQ